MRGEREGMKPVAAFRHRSLAIPDHLRRHAHGDGVGRNVLGDDGAGADDGAVADGHAGEGSAEATRTDRHHTPVIWRTSDKQSAAQRLRST